MTVADQRSGDFRSFHGVIDLKFRGIKGTEEYVIFLHSPGPRGLQSHLPLSSHFTICNRRTKLKIFAGAFCLGFFFGGGVGVRFLEIPHQESRRTKLIQIS